MNQIGEKTQLSEKITLNQFIFSLNEVDNTASVIGTQKAEGEILIPTSINYKGHEFIITEISENTFKFLYGIKSVKFLDNSKLLKIGKEAFTKSSIKSISIPSHVTKICDCAFSYCNQLQQIKFENNSELEIIERGAFFKASIENILIPSHVNKIYGYSFYQCGKLKKLEFEQNSDLHTIEKFIFYGSPIESISMPSSVVELHHGWCYGTPKLNSINIFINNNTINIKNYDKLVIGKSSLISENFDVLHFSPRKVKSITIPPFIKIIAPYSFSDSLIERIIIPSSVTKIGEFAFFHCNKLKKVEIEGNSELRSIEKSAFANSSIESISIPSSVVEFKKEWCYDTPKLNHINIIKNNEIENIKKYDENIIIGKSNISKDNFDVLLFSTRKIKKIEIPPFIKILSSYAFSESTIETIQIPSFVTHINEGSFYFCRKLRKVNFEKKSELSFIGKFAFSYSSIESISLPSHVTQIFDEAFSYCEQLRIIEFGEFIDVQLMDMKILGSSAQSVIIMIHYFIKNSF